MRNLVFDDIAALPQDCEVEALAPANIRRGSSQLAAQIRGAVEGPMPSTWRPQLAGQAASPPTADGWIHEIKFDGFRAIALVKNGTVRLLTRNGHDWTSRYGVLAKAFERLPCESAILDGEIAVQDARGVTSLHGLQRALADGQTHALTFFAFDLPYLDGRDLRKGRLVDRKAALERLIASRVQANSPLQFSTHCEADGEALFARANLLGMEGIVSKRADSPYVHARSASWVKVKQTETKRLVIIGFLSNMPGRASSLILAEERGGELAYCCRAGAGLTADDTRELYGILAKIGRDRPAVAAPRKAGARWVEPAWSVEVAFQGRTTLGKPRAPVVLSWAHQLSGFSASR